MQFRKHATIVTDMNLEKINAPQPTKTMRRSTLEIMIGIEMPRYAKQKFSHI